MVFITQVLVLHLMAPLSSALTLTAAIISIGRPTFARLQFLTSSSMPAADCALLSAQGIYEVVVAPSNPNYWYMVWNGYFYSSTNRGGNWTKQTALAQDTTAAPNAANRGQGPRMAVDPVNPLVVFVCMPTGGVFYTTNGGTTFSSAISTGSIPAPTGPTGGNPVLHTCVGFDPELKQQRQYASRLTCIATTLAMASTKTSSYSGGTWAKVTGMPTTNNYLIKSTILVMSFA